jgi:hypothetical protein
VNLLNSQVEFYSMKISHLKKLNFTLDPSTTLLDIDYDYFSTNSPLLDDISRFFQNQSLAKEVVSIFNEDFYCLKNLKKFSPIHLSTLEKYKGSEYANSRSHVKEFWIQKILSTFTFGCFEKKMSWDKYLKCTVVARKLWCKGNKSAERLFLLFQDYMDHVRENLDDLDDWKDIVQEANSASSLPESLKTGFEIRKSAEELKQFIKEIGLTSKPHYITLTQSNGCGHTPRHKIDFIKHEIYEMISDLYLKN